MTIISFLRGLFLADQCDRVVGCGPAWARRRGVSLAAALAGTGMTWRQLLHEKRLIAFGEEFGHVTPDPALRGRCLALKLGRAVGPI